MKKYILLGTILLLSACGYSSIDNEAIGQVKKTMTINPIFCPQYKVADIIVGSQQALEQAFYIQNANKTNNSNSMNLHTAIVVSVEQNKILQEALEKGKTIKFTYNEERITFCTTSRLFMQSVEIIE